MTERSQARSFIEALDPLSRADLRPEVSSRLKETLLDYIGVAYAGAVSQGAKLDTLLGCADEGRFCVIGAAADVSLCDCVFFNGLNAHALDLDDGVNAGIIHLASPIFSLLIPLAEKHGRSGSDLLKAAAIGYEAAWSLAASIQPGHKLRGYHATGTCGMLGAVAAGAHLLGFDPEESFRAFSTGCVSAGGILKALDDSSELKPYNVAKASLLALASLRMGRAGFAVPNDALGGERGFLELMAEGRDVKLRRPLADGEHAVMRTYTKPYAACRYCHPAIEAAVSLGREAAVPPDEVESILVDTYELAVRGHDHTRVQGTASAKMSIPYGVAVGYLRGAAGLSEYSEECLGDREIQSLCSKVRVLADDGFTAAFPGDTVAVVTLKTGSGAVLRRRVDHPLGEPENPLGAEGVRRKFKEMTSFANMSPTWQDGVVGSVADVETRLPDLLRLLKERGDAQ